MKIRKAVITSAGRGQRTLPLQTLVDRDGTAKSALRIILEEAAAAGVDQIAVIVSPGDQSAYEAAARAAGGGVASGDLGRMLTFIEQPTPAGYGHALYCAREFVGAEPFLHMVGDHLYVSRDGKRCAQQLVEVATAQACAVSAVQPTREGMLPYYGALGGRRVPHAAGLYEVETVAEKPTPTDAEQKLTVPGLRAGHYLCFFGMHVLTPAVMDVLGELVEQSKAARSREKSQELVQLSPALDRLAGKERYLAMELRGRRHNIGVKYGLLTAQLALALEGQDREDVMAQLIELLAQRAQVV